jgi:hypothetical protein
MIHTKLQKLIDIFLKYINIESALKSNILNRPQSHEGTRFIIYFISNASKNKYLVSLCLSGLKTHFGVDSTLHDPFCQQSHILNMMGVWEHVNRLASGHFIQLAQ